MVADKNKPSDSHKCSKQPPVVSAPIEVLAKSDESETILETEEKEEPKTLPKIRLRVEEEAVKVKQFATAQGLSMHIKVTKAKRAGLGALHKVATWLTPKKK